MKTIEFELSDELFSKLNDIKNELIVKENFNVSLSDMIEESLLSYYDIKLYNIKKIHDKISDAIIVDENIKETNGKYYVYGIYQINEDNPIYVGINAEDNKANVYYSLPMSLISIIENLKLKNEITIKEINFNLTEIEANHHKQLLISKFGRLNNGTGCLYNRTGGNKTVELEYVNYLLKTLNENKKISRTARKMNVPTKTIHRKIKKHLIGKDIDTNIWQIISK